MDTILISILIIIAAVILFFVAKNSGAKKEEKPDKAFDLLLQQMNELSRTVDRKMGDTTKAMSDSLHKQFSESAKLIRDVTEGLTKLDETNKQVVSFTDQLQSLHDIFSNPKQRGVVGEYFLETLLRNVLPPGSFQMQYAFKDGTIVDAIVKIQDKIIPIDSKFSFENYQRLVEERNSTERERLEKDFVNDLKNRIVETSKYIKQAEGTMDFAFMFIPHEAIYYDLLTNKVGALHGDNENLIQRAASKYKVIIVSPTSFLAYLQTVLQGLKALQIEDQAKDIIKRVSELGKHLNVYGQYQEKMGNAISTVVNHFNASHKEFRKIDKDVLKITGEIVGVKELMLDKPEEGVE
jgi:DNA recombination protein RmuC